MKLILRRIRGALGMSVMWALTWALLSPIGTLLMRTERGEFFVPSPSLFLLNAVTFAMAGAIGGLIFGICLATDARPSLSRLSLKRVAAWSGLSGVLFPFAFEVGGRLLASRPVFWFHAQMLTEFAVAGVISGATIVALALSRARKDPPELDISAMRELSGSAWTHTTAERAPEVTYSSTSF